MTDESDTSPAWLRPSALARRATRLTWQWVLPLVLIGLGLALMLALMAQRHAEAKGVYDAALIVRDIAGRIRYEALREPRATLQDLAERADSVRSTDTATVKARTEALASAGFVVTISRRGELVPVAGGRGSVMQSPLAPSVLTLGGTRYLAADGSGGFLFPAAWQDKVLLGKALGGVSPVDIHAAIQVGQARLHQAAQGVLQPGVELAFYRNGTRAVNLVRETGHDVLIDTSRDRVPLDVLQDDSTGLNLGNAPDWPGFLLLGGHEVDGLHLRTEQRSGIVHQVVYLRDGGESKDPWNGVSFAFPAEDEAKGTLWIAGEVGAGMLAYVLACALLLARRERYKRAIGGPAAK